MESIFDKLGEIVEDFFATFPSKTEEYAESDEEAIHDVDLAEKKGLGKLQ